MNIAVFSAKSYDKEYFSKHNKTYNHTLTYFDAPLDTKTVSLTKEFDVVCVFVNDTIDAKTIAELAENGVQIVALRCAGFNNVDLEAAKKHNIRVVRVPAYSPHAVVEHAIALLFTLNRKTHKAYNRIRENNYSLEKLIGYDVYGKTVGIIGTGNIGKIFAEIIKGFGCRVLLYDIYPSEELQEKGFEYVSLETLCEESDIISLHCPLNKNTKHIINTKSLKTMKQGVVIINTSRGGLINTKDAIKALKTKKIGALGIDVYEQEENLFFRDLSESIIYDDVIARLITFPNVLITSHQGFFTHDALTEIAETTLSNISNFEKGNVTNQVEI
ncbi:MAG: 2-hydroxyacid dehydrogenase [Bacteroidales bacterium]|jgi:D-lactate dehydrogenase|nr:2-hydroxyacid dehydrogenase [Bacteroidales bacterium]